MTSSVPWLPCHGGIEARFLKKDLVSKTFRAAKLSSISVWCYLLRFHGHFHQDFSQYLLSIFSLYSRSSNSNNIILVSLSSPLMSFHFTLTLIFLTIVVGSLLSLKTPVSQSINISLLASGASPAVSILTHLCWLNLNPIYHCDATLKQPCPKVMLSFPSPSLFIFSSLIHLTRAVCIQ